MQFITKYLLLLLLCENVAIKSKIFGSYSNYFFYAFLGVGLLLLFNDKFLSHESIMKNKWIYFLIIIYTFYEFIIGSEYLGADTLQYYIARLVTFAIVSVGVSQNYSFYLSKCPRILSFTIMSIMLIGLFGGFSINEERLSAGYSNANSAAGIVAIFLAFTLYDRKLGKWDTKKILFVVFGLYILMFCGSRAGLLTVLIISLIRYKAKIGFVLFVVCALLVSEYVLPNYGIHLTAIERSIGTLQGEVNIDREMPRAATIMMIKEKPLTGWGLDSDIQGQALIVSELGSHNGYLDTARFIGIPLAILYFVNIFSVIVRHYRILRKHNEDPDVFFAISVAFIALAMYEGLFTGVHEVETNVLFFSLAMISTRSFMLENNGPLDTLK